MIYEEHEYKVIKEFPKYEINCHGHIRDIDTKRTKYTLVGKLGYRMVQFKSGGNIYGRKVHRLVAENFLEDPSEALIEECKRTTKHGKVCVNHKDGDKDNNYYLNLEWCTHQHNTKHASDTGLNPAPQGELNGRAVLTEVIVHKVCKFFEEGGMPKKASEIFGISRQQATKIRAGVNWNHIWKQYNIKVNRRKKKP